MRRSGTRFGIRLSNVLLLTLGIVATAAAGTLEPPAGEAMPSLEDVYRKATYLLDVSRGHAGDGEASSPDPSGPLREPTVPPGPTMHSLREIYDVLTALEEAWPRAPVEKSGQVASQAPGDDGALQPGVPWPVPRFEDHGDGTVTDRLTGLVWTKRANRFPAMPWLDALATCAALGDDGVDLTDGSRPGDWRLPQIKELQSLVDWGYWNPALPDTEGSGQWSEGDPFIGVSPFHYWSATSMAGNPVYAWSLKFSHGYVYDQMKIKSYSVWCVRDGGARP